MKKLISIIALATLLISTGITSAYAVYFEEPPEEFYFTNADQSAQYDLDTPYTLGDTPYLYFSFYASNVDENNLKTSAWYGDYWVNPTSTYYNQGIDTFDRAWFMLALPNGADTLGQWDVSATFKSVANQPTSPFVTKNGAYSVVTPEPISTVLFTVGGIAFIARRKFMAK